MQRRQTNSISLSIPTNLSCSVGPYLRQDWVTQNVERGESVVEVQLLSDSTVQYSTVQYSKVEYKPVVEVQLLPSLDVPLGEYRDPGRLTG